MVDIIGFDRYAKAETFKDYLLADCEAACAFAESVNKPCAAAEIGIADGIELIANEDWYMTDLLDNIMSSDSCKRISYMLTWSNESPRRYWVPLPTDTTAPGFVSFSEDTQTLFQGDVRWDQQRETYGYGFKSNEDDDVHDMDIKSVKGNKQH